MSVVKRIRVGPRQPISCLPYAVAANQTGIRLVVRVLDDMSCRTPYQVRGKL